MSLEKAALAVRENAYAPYSNFKVGAAIRSADGTVYSGCNVENIAYPEGTCAEAGAIAAMVAEIWNDPRQRQLFKNLVYVGALIGLIGLDEEIAEQLIHDQ